MSNLPQDNTAVDDNRRFIKGWLDYQRRLEPASTLSASDVAAIKALIGSSGEIESGEIGDIQYRGADGLVNLPIGAIGAWLGVNAAGNAPEWGGGGGWLGFISETALPSSTTVTITEFSAYNHLFITINKLKATGSASPEISIITANGAETLAHGYVASLAGGSGTSGVATLMHWGSLGSSSEELNGIIFISNIRSGKYPQLMTWSNRMTDGFAEFGSGTIVTTSPLLGVSIILNAAETYSSGSVSLYGIR